MTIDEFCEEVLRLRPNHFMGMNGAAAGIIGSSDSGTDALAQLQRTVLAFADQYKAGKPADVLQVSKKEVIGKVMVAVTLDAMSEEKADELIDGLMQIMKGSN